MKDEDRLRPLRGPLEPVLKADLAKAGPFDLVLADPPYAGGWEMKLLETLSWSEILMENGLFCLEWGTQKSKVETLPDQVFLVAAEGNPSSPAAQLVKIREKNYGDSVLSTYSKRTTGLS